ncbi:MAG: alpha/beta hydrolase [Gammaproteobacteria bacterium]|nr:alpha/beta hydrolase [Gammaproteobacteria bacterium]
MNAPTLPDWNAPELAVTRPAPAWFGEALARPFASHVVDVLDCPIHYLRWTPPTESGARRGVLLVHGGGAHANWWRFIAPFLAADYVVAALDLSGMGDSGRRDSYDAAQRSAEMLAVAAAAGLGPRPFVVGHSFGGYQAMRLGAKHGGELGGVVIIDSPIRPPGHEEDPVPRRALKVERHYPSFDIAVERFRLMPPQECANDYLVEFIARHSIRQAAAGWTWKFDVAAMGARRWEEPFPEHCANLACRAALLYGERSALVDASVVRHMAGLLGPHAPVIGIPDAHHHVMLDQPLACVTALRAVLAGWACAD